MDRTELERLEAIESEAKDAWRAAKDNADAARIEMAEGQLKAKGINFGETICLVPKWGFSSRETVRAIVLRASGSGEVICQPVTKSNKPHGGQNSFAAHCDKIQPEQSSTE